MRSLLRTIATGYVVGGVWFGTIVWLSYLWPVTWGAPASMGFFQQVIGVFTMQPIAILSGGVRFALWAPSLLMWALAPGEYSFGEWLAPGFYSEVIAK